MWLFKRKPKPEFVWELVRHTHLIRDAEGTTHQPVYDVCMEHQGPERIIALCDALQTKLPPLSRRWTPEQLEEGTDFTCLVCLGTKLP